MPLPWTASVSGDCGGCIPTSIPDGGAFAFHTVIVPVGLIKPVIDYR
jgi:hypothetical protein